MTAILEETLCGFDHCLATPVQHFNSDMHSFCNKIQSGIMPRLHFNPLKHGHETIADNSNKKLNI